jgi:hypothetical protein
MKQVQRHAISVLIAMLCVGLAWQIDDWRVWAVAFGSQFLLILRDRTNQP